jgi:regulator of protease activity HflC (stomatin/prohibitin superfamily)
MANLMLEILWILVLVAVILVIALKVFPVKHVTIYEYQRGLLYKKGRYVTLLHPGSYWISSVFSTVSAMDMRPEFITIPGQDLLSADGVTIKISLAAEFQVEDPNLAINRTANFRGNLYVLLQMALREIVGKEKIDALVENRSGIGGKLLEMTQGKVAGMGVKLISADIKDIMFSGEMKKAFAQVIKAQKEGQAALERARGETAALRSLANAARTMDDNPNLLQLRALQVLGDSSGNTLVLGLPGSALSLTKQNGVKSASGKTEE